MNEKNTLTITRTLNAPREKVWAHCSLEAELPRWWGQGNGAVMPYMKLDFRIGGSLHYMVELPDEEIVWGMSVYKEIVPLEQIVFDEYFSNEKGELLDGEDMYKSEITLTLLAEGEHTQLAIRQVGQGIGAHTMKEYSLGWNESLDRLERSLSLT